MCERASSVRLASAQLLQTHVLAPSWASLLRSLGLALILMMMSHVVWFTHNDYRLPGDDAFMGTLGGPTAPPCGASLDEATGLPRLAIVATLKPFSADPESEVRQENAVKSWVRSYPAARVYLVGDTATAVARDWGVVRGALRAR